MARDNSSLQGEIRTKDGVLIATFEYLSFSDLNSADDALELQLSARYKVKNLQVYFHTVSFYEAK